jgi:hypothetical protein
MEYTKIYPAVQHQYLESPAPQDGLTNMPETSLPVDQFQVIIFALSERETSDFDPNYRDSARIWT